MRTRSSPHSSCLDLESYMSDGKWVWHQASGKKMEYEWGMIHKRHVLCHTLFLFDTPNNVCHIMYCVIMVFTRILGLL
jgi:hypothetical protein